MALAWPPNFCQHVYQTTVTTSVFIFFYFPENIVHGCSSWPDEGKIN